MKLILHIGTEKTGTTAIQKFLASKVNLERFKLSTPKRQGTGNHSYVAAYAMENGSKDVCLRMRNLHNDPTSHRSFRKLIADAISKDISDAQFEDFVISSEDLQRLFKDTEVSRLSELLTPLFDEIQIVAFVRRQDELALSRHGMLVRDGFGDRFAFAKIGPEVRDNFYDYKNLYARWRAGFPKAQIRLVPYGANSINVGRDSIDLFLEAIGAEPLSRASTLIENVSISPARYRFFQMLRNTQGPRVKYGEIVDLLRALPLSDLDPVLPATRQRAREFLIHFKKSNQAIGSILGGMPPFSDDCSMYPESFSWDEFDKRVLLSISAAIYRRHVNGEGDDPADWIGCA
jgi:hypothetical protein